MLLVLHILTALVSSIETSGLFVVIFLDALPFKPLEPAYFKNRAENQLQVKITAIKLQDCIHHADSNSERLIKILKIC